MVCYAQLDANNLCIGISQLSGEVHDPKLVLIGQADPDLLWRQYENGQWSTEKYEPIVESAISLDQQMQALREDNLILMDALATIFEEILFLRGE